LLIFLPKWQHKLIIIQLPLKVMPHTQIIGLFEVHLILLSMIPLLLSLNRSLPTTSPLIFIILTITTAIVIILLSGGDDRLSLLQGLEEELEGLAHAELDHLLLGLAEGAEFADENVEGRHVMGPLRPLLEVVPHLLQGL